MARKWPPSEAASLAGTGDEPWVKLADGRDLADWSREDEIAYNQINRQTEKLRFFRRIFDFITENRVVGDYHEFGCGIL